MKKSFLAPTLTMVVLLAGASGVVRAQVAESNYDRMVRISHAYQVNLDVTYRIVNNWDAKLDIIRPRQSSAPTPTVLYFHGAGWK